ncbi:MAG TPA: hypothetical protein PKK95_10455 [Vicinamibacterales bacterium]|nr:hypothetical protein [Vicinamibacterales bacterium]
MESRARHFNVRAFAALVMTASGIGLPLTGYMHHVYGLEAMSVARHAWMSAHNLLGVLFTVSAVCHAWMNRRALLGHVRGARARLGAVNREAISAAALVLAGLALFVGHAFRAGGFR